jgi:hypothetical protein
MRVTADPSVTDATTADLVADGRACTRRPRLRAARPTLRDDHNGPGRREAGRGGRGSAILRHPWRGDLHTAWLTPSVPPRFQSSHALAGSVIKDPVVTDAATCLHRPVKQWAGRGRAMAARSRADPALSRWRSRPPSIASFPARGGSHPALASDPHAAMTMRWPHRTCFSAGEGGVRLGRPLLLPPRLRLQRCVYPIIARGV